MKRILLGFILLLTALASAAPALRFTDKDLALYLKKHPQGLIYMVSANMPLSLKGLSEYQAIAAQKNIPFLVLYDPLTQNRKNMMGLSLENIPVLDSKDLAARGAIQHFPAFLFYKGGKISGNFNPGYEAPEKFSARLQDFFK